MAFVCLMTMVVSFTSCSNDNVFERFKINTSKLPNNGKNSVLETALLRFEDRIKIDCKSNYETSELVYSKIHLYTDSLVLGEVAIRGKNSFDGYNVSKLLFVYLDNKLDDGYLATMNIEDDYFYKFVLRLELEKNEAKKYELLSKFAKVYGFLVNETEYDVAKRIIKEADFPKDNEFLYFAKDLLDRSLSL